MKYEANVSTLVMGDAMQKLTALGATILGFESEGEDAKSISVDISGEQIPLFETWLEEWTQDLDKRTYCDFCGKGDNEVSKQFAAMQKDIYICSECVLVYAARLENEPKTN